VKNNRTTPITLHETNIAPENGWLEFGILSFWDGPFSGAMLVLGRVFTKSFATVLDNLFTVDFRF